MLGLDCITCMYRYNCATKYDYSIHNNGFMVDHSNMLHVEISNNYYCGIMLGGLLIDTAIGWVVLSMICVSIV